MPNSPNDLLKTGSTGIQDHIARSFHQLGSAYAALDVYEAEKRSIFQRAWLFVAREEELPNAGDYMALRIVGEPVVVVRQDDGSIAALANVCRHRGVEVATGTGNARHFTCPYHGWLYDIDGALNVAPYMTRSEADLSHCRLPRLQTRLWRGFVFLSFADHPEDFDAFIAPFEAQFGFLQPENCRVGLRRTFDVTCNWKLAVENLMDIYHAGVVHASSFGRYYRGNKNDYEFNLLPNGGYSFFLEAAPFTKSAKSSFGKFPWLKDHKDTLAYTGFLPPNMPFVGRSDSFRIWSVWPLDVDHTRLVSHTMFAAEALQDPEFETKVRPYEATLKQVVEEDRQMIESLHLGVRSINFAPGPFSHLETAIHHAIRNYLERMGVSA